MEGQLSCPFCLVRNAKTGWRRGGQGEGRGEKRIRGPNTRTSCLSQGAPARGCGTGGFRRSGRRHKNVLEVDPAAGGAFGDAVRSRRCSEVQRWKPRNPGCMATCELCREEGSRGLRVGRSHQVHVDAEPGAVLVSLPALGPPRAPPVE